MKNLNTAFDILTKHHNNRVNLQGESPSEYNEDDILKAMQEYAEAYAKEVNKEQKEAHRLLRAVVVDNYGIIKSWELNPSTRDKIEAYLDKVNAE